MEKKFSKYEKEVCRYFADKAEEYDDVENQTYWQLSDKLLWTLIQEQLGKLKRDFLFLDAGGGTGRWSKMILDNYPNARGVLVDLSKDMLIQAKKKNFFGERWQILNGDLQDLNFQDKTFDFVLNTHNVLGFVENTDKALIEMSRVLKEDGILVSVIPNKHHAIFFNIFLKNILGAKDILKYNKGKFVDNMPEMNMFSPKIIKKLYSKARLRNCFCWGFPIYIYPGYQETQLQGESQQAKDILLENMENIYQLENSSIRDEDLASRGNNLFVVGIK